MKLEEAIEYLQELKQTLKTAFWSKEYVDSRVVAIDTVLKELDRQKQVKEKILKAGFEEGYNQGYLAGTMERI